MIRAGSDQTAEKAGKRSDQGHPQGRAGAPSRSVMVLPGMPLSFIADNCCSGMPRRQGARRPIEKGEGVRIWRRCGIEIESGAIALCRGSQGAGEVRTETLPANIGIMFSPILPESVQEMARAKQQALYSDRFTFRAGIRFEANRT